MAEVTYTKSTRASRGFPNADQLSQHRRGTPEGAGMTVYVEPGIFGEVPWDIVSTWTEADITKQALADAQQVPIREEPELRYAPPEPFRVMGNTKALQPIITEIRAEGVSFSAELIRGDELTILGVNPDKEGHLRDALGRYEVPYQDVSAGKGASTPTQPLPTEPASLSDMGRDLAVRKAIEAATDLVEYLKMLQTIGMLDDWLRDNADDVKALREWLGRV
jgi:hypothetical protein